MALTLNNNLNSLKVGDYFWCKYTVTTANTVGVFSDIATKTDAEATPVIPVASSNLPNGYFRFIMVEDWNGKKRLIADRNIQHSISWDVLNTSGIASSSGLPVIFSEYNSQNYQFSMRLLTGGISGTDKDNEWDKYIVNSNLNENITVGDNIIWNYDSGSALRTLTSTVSTDGSSYRTMRGYVGNINAYTSTTTNTSDSQKGFRPMLEIETNLINKSFILLSDGYKKLNKGNPEIKEIYTNAVPKMTSNTTPSGIASASTTAGVGNDSYLAFDNEVGSSSQWATRNKSITGWLSYQFTIGKVIKKYAVTGSSVNTSSPKNWTFEGSNNGSDWIVLDSKSNISWLVNERKEFVINNVNSYYIYRINITSNNGNDAYVMISELELMELTPYSPATPSSFKTISSTLPTSTQFQTEGMDDLSIFDRKVQVLPSIQLSENTSLGEGKVFKGKIDLKKYFDIKKIEVK